MRRAAKARELAAELRAVDERCECSRCDVMRRAAGLLLELADELDHAWAECTLARKAVRHARAASIPREVRLRPAPAPDLGPGGNVA